MDVMTGEPLSGADVVAELIKAALERGLQAELTGHVGYEKGDPEASLFPNSRNGTTPKTVLSPWLHYYNHQRPHGSLGHKAPITALAAT